MNKKSLKYKIARQIIHLRIYVILIFTFITLYFIGVIKDMKFQTTLQDFYPQKHPFIKVHNRLSEIFGGLNQVSIALKVKEGDIFNKTFLEKVISLTEELYLTEGVNPSRIISLASRHIKHVVANKEGFFVYRLLRDVPQSLEEMQILKERIVNNPNIYGRLVSKDLKSVLIQVDFQANVSTKFIFDFLQNLQNKYQDSNTIVYFAGRPVLEGWMNFYLPQMIKILILSILVIGVVLYFTFRSKRGVILPLLDSSMATVWGIGAMKLMGLKLDPSTILVPFIVLSLGISHSVHTLKRYYEEMRNPGMKSKHAIVNTMVHLFVPGATCVLTDGFGFLSLMLVPIPTIKSMAMASGLGIIANFFTSFMFTPAILSFMHRPKILEVEREERHIWVDKFLKSLAIFSISKKAGTFVVLVFVVVALISTIGISKIVIGDNTEGSGYLYPHSPYNQAEKFINTHFGGTNSYFILVESSKSLLNYNSLSKMDSLQQFLIKNVPSAGRGFSVVNAIKGLNMCMMDGKRQFYKLPANDLTIAQYWFLYTISGFPDDFAHLISRDETKANIKIELKDHKSKTVESIVNFTKEWIEKNKTSFKDINFSYAGGDIGILFAINDIIKKTIIPNILFIFLLIFLYVSIVYRSIVAGVFLLIPLALSTLIIFSLFGFLGTSLTTETLALASLSEGLGVNYGIYIVARLFEEMKEKHTTYKNILYQTLITSGKAVFFSGFIVSLGILVWVFSDILLQVKLGVNLCLSLILNMITSLIILPVLVWWIKPYFLFGEVKKRLKGVKK